MLSHHWQIFGLKINTTKTKAIRIKSQIDHPIKVENADIEDVVDFTYLDSKVLKNGNSAIEFNGKAEKSKKSKCVVQKIWNSNEI